MELLNVEQLTKVLSCHINKNLSKCKLKENKFFNCFDFILDRNVVPNFEDKFFQDTFQVRFIKKKNDNKYRIYCTNLILLIKWYKSYDEFQNEYIIMLDYHIIKRRD